MNTKDKGDITEAMVAARLLQTGVAVLKPLGDNQRYDLVTDDGTNFKKVQCKTGRLRTGSVKFNTVSSDRVGVVDSYHGQADYFGVYCQELDSVYIVPVAICGSGTKSLRVTESSFIPDEMLWAKDYKI